MLGYELLVLPQGHVPADGELPAEKVPSNKNPQARTLLEKMREIRMQILGDATLSPGQKRSAPEKALRVRDLHQESPAFLRERESGTGSWERGLCAVPDCAKAQPMQAAAGV